MNGFSVAQVATQTGYPKTLLNKKIFDGIIPTESGMVTEEAMKRILDEKKAYISLTELAKSITSETFNGKKSIHRNRLLIELERNDFYGFEVFDASEIMMGTEMEKVYFCREDAPSLIKKLGLFLKYYRVPEKQKAMGLIENYKDGHEKTCTFLKSYIDEDLGDPKTLPPSFTEFVQTVFKLPDIDKLKAEDIKSAVGEKMTASAKDYLVNFLNYCRDRSTVCYAEVSLAKAPSRSAPSYSDDTYIELCKCVFNREFIASHAMVEKALDNHWYAEAWLFISAFITCGWRGGDLCSGWKYLHLDDKEDGFLGINKDALYEDILHGRITDEIYENVCKYSLSSVIAAEEFPSKTADRNPTTLRNMITPGLHSFFGMLTLIAEAVHLKTGEGYMKKNREPSYLNKVTLRDFFGKEILVPLHGRNLQSRRLNKVFLQGVEKKGRELGYGGLLTSAVASYARNHTSLDTITHYLKDHNLDGENAEMVVYFMMERGVFGFEIYQTLLTAYPDVMKKLPLEKQNQLIAEMNADPLKTELFQSGVVIKNYVKERFRNGDKDYVVDILKDMFEISQTRGKAKDSGVYCLKRVRGEICEDPECKSCLANACSHVVFTAYGLRPLIEVLKEAMNAAKESKKAEAVLKTILIPRYQEIINTVVRQAHMNDGEKAGIKKIMEVMLNEKQSSTD